MAIAQMKKIMIASHRSEAGEVLEALQKAGVVEILDAERAMVSKEWPELQVEPKRPRDLQELVSRILTSISFLNDHAVEKPQKSPLAPLVEMDSCKYSDIITDNEDMTLLKEAEELEVSVEKLSTEKENAEGMIDMLEPWKGLSVRLEELGSLDTTACLTGLLPDQSIAEVTENLARLGAVIESVGSKDTMKACLAVCARENTAKVQKALRGGDFEPVSFEGMSGTVAELLKEWKDRLESKNSELESVNNKAAQLSRDIFTLEVQYDHYQNLYEREQTEANSPATDNTVIYEGWVREKDYKKLQKIISSFKASSVDEMQVAEGEERPVDIYNGAAVRPFETITRLYGMPAVKDVDPTMFLAPFFALFFGLCLTDAGYGLVMVAALWWVLRKFQGNKGVLIMFLACSAVTVVAGALTGSWFGDSITTLIGEGSRLDIVRKKIMLFDPMKDPMTFFLLSLGLGYFQILCGLVIAFCNNLKHKDYAEAVFGQLTWLIFLNSLLVFGLSKGGMLPGALAPFCKWLAIITAVLIFLFTERKSGIAGRIGGGVFALFGAVFYFGDILSYVRLMALGMVTAGLGMAVNILVKLLMDVPYVGFILGGLLFVVGHLFNLAMSTLSSFVHSLRLQFVEFFPKFLEGGGRDFLPLKKKFKHVLVNPGEQSE